MKEPVFGKRESRPYDYQEMTWEKFIKLRKWAKESSSEIGYPIYLVGSTLQKVKPRDFDVVVIIPIEDFEEMFGQLTESNYAQILANAFNKYVDQYFEGCEAVGEFGFVPFDFKVYPDNWFKEEDKLLLS